LGSIKQHSTTQGDVTLTFLAPPESLGEMPDGESSPAQVAIHQSLSMAVGLWRALPRSCASAEALAWFALLSKCIEVLIGLRAAELGQSRLAFEAVDRAALELHLQLHAIVAPLVATGSLDDVPKRRLDELRQLLRKYAAWTLHNEAGRLDEIADRGTLDDLFEGQSARDLAMALGTALPDCEQTFGEVPVLSDAELALDRQKFEASLGGLRRQVQNIIDQLALGPLIDRLRKVLEDAAKTNKVSRGSQSFPSVVALLQGDNARGVRAQLGRAQLGFAYSGYARNSQVVHASDLGLEVSPEGEIVPQWGVVELDDRIGELAIRLRQHLVRLAVLLQHLPSPTK
jgi:hypothetical protein